jgi:hypothetical protein
VNSNRQCPFLRWPTLHPSRRGSQVPKPDLRVVNQPKEEDLNAWFARNMPPSLQPIAQVPGHLSGTGLRWCPLHPPGSRERARSRRATQTRITTPSRRLPLSSTGAYLCPEVAQCPPGRLPGHGELVHTGKYVSLRIGPEDRRRFQAAHPPKLLRLR